MIKKFTFWLVLILISPALAGCSSLSKSSAPPSKGYYKVGSPYVIKGRRYYPEVDYRYDETGIASWYGPNFNGKPTANGEIFDQNELTAAHKTLPLPSIVRVTNLENGKSLIIRVNDRGPYAHGRIIDLSKRSAELLGFKNKGTAKVRVQALEAESKLVAKVAQAGKHTKGMEVAMNKPGYQSPVQAGTHDQAVFSPEQRPATYQTASLQTGQPRTIPGHDKGGVFYPDPIISEQAVKSSQLFVQMGSFSTRENAMKYSSALRNQGYAPPLIQTALINGQEYYRVRLKADSVSSADELLDKVLRDGHSRAIIIVD